MRHTTKTRRISRKRNMSRQISRKRKLSRQISRKRNVSRQISRKRNVSRQISRKRNVSRRISRKRNVSIRVLKVTKKKIPRSPVYNQPLPRSIPRSPVYKQPVPRAIPKSPVYKQPVPIPKSPVYKQPVPRAIPKSPVYKQPVPRDIPKSPVYKQPLPRSTKSPELESKNDSDLSFMSNIDYISGPTKLYEISIGDKHLYLFGEKHTLGTCEQKPKSIDITTFISKVLSTQQAIPIDFYLETVNISMDEGYNKYNPDGEVGSWDDLVQLRNLIAACIPSKKTKIRNDTMCKIGKNRAHWIDVRQLESFVTDKDFIDISKMMSDYASGVKKPNDPDLKHEASKLEKYLKKYNTLVKKVVCKEISKLDNIEVKEYLLKLFKIHEYTQLDNNEYINLITNLQSIWKIEVTHVDLYTLARMFKSYSKNIIFYGGGNHTDRMVEILSKMKDYKLIKKVVLKDVDSDYEKKCLDIRSFKRPFFS
jgi:hypothetical protein